MPSPLCSPCRSASRNLRQISSKGRQRKLISILMIVDIKVAGKTGAGEFGFGPTAVGVLPVEQIFNAHPDIVSVVIAGGHQPDQSPGGLRRRARSLAALFRFLVRPAGPGPAAAPFPPAA